jgi:hypothetical protein
MIQFMARQVMRDEEGEASDSDSEPLEDTRRVEQMEDSRPSRKPASGSDEENEAPKPKKKLRVIKKEPITPKEKEKPTDGQCQEENLGIGRGW